jgi:hypothetical protein
LSALLSGRLLTVLLALSAAIFSGIEGVFMNYDFSDLFILLFGILLLSLYLYIFFKGF